MKKNRESVGPAVLLSRQNRKAADTRVRCQYDLCMSRI